MDSLTDAHRGKAAKSAALARDVPVIRALRVRPVDVPLMPVLESAAGTLRTAPLVLVDLLTEEGITGSAYIFTYSALALGPTATLIRNLEPLLKGQPLAPLAIHRELSSRFRLLGSQGLVGLALAAIDMAAWDAHARSIGLPLARALGARGDEPIDAYLSVRGATVERICKEAEDAKDKGFAAYKLKTGLARNERELISALRAVVGGEARIMVDYNQVLTVPEAKERARLLDDLGVYWMEEPVRADDYAGHAAIARSARTPVQLGENYWGPHEVARSIAMEASDMIMPDLMKIGGVTGWMAASALCEAASLPISSHLFVEFSSHVLAATPARHYLEWMDFAGPILSEGAPKVLGGQVVPTQTLGAGLAWDEDAVKRYAFS